MPITVDAPIRKLTQAEFGQIAYRVVNAAFQVHHDMGRFFDEPIYQAALVACVPAARREVPIAVTFGDFRMNFSIDLLVEDSAVFELKAVETLGNVHRAQLLNYLLLTELAHGKLINLRPDSVKHEFVNTTLTRTDRTGFTVDDAGWVAPDAAPVDLKSLLVSMLRDWGTGLELTLYVKALTHFLGGDEQVIREVAIERDGVALGTQKLRLATPTASFHVTGINRPDEQQHFANHARRLLRHTSLQSLLWINITLHRVSFRTFVREKT